MKASQERTTTQMAILGLVASAPASAYDLAARMRIHYAYFWPRARSLVFAEVKRMAAAGWLTGRRESRGKRARIVYAATPAGRATLKAWLATPSRGFAIELEPVVRLYLSRFGSDRDLDRALAHAEDEAAKMFRIGEELLRLYLAGTPPPPADRLRDRVLLFDFFLGFATFMQGWARASRREVASWRTSSDAAVAARNRRALERHLAALRR